MKFNWIGSLPEEPKEFLLTVKNQFKLPLEEAFKLFYLTLRVKASSDSPIYKFLERTPTGIKFDEIGKREFLLTLSGYTLRELISQHIDLKLVKNLYLFLSKEIPSEFLKDVLPKHSILVSQDVLLEILTTKEKAYLPAFLKAKHILFTVKIEGACEDLLKITPFLPNFFFILDHPSTGLSLYTSFSISEFFLFSLKIERFKSIKDEVEKILERLKALFPECFGEI
ncbi:hypothetical protein F1847_06625 [Thermodesulfobacterium sp. TA1]|uniref:hypothetical protein n=1 Tax=Thermodesulfobacterium sp. TA1 TaxID=2234087 RepID=UPI001231AFD1|nr:hypothetical protein [Thermodesulfobacterium sp. TA1]QER42434.1 hypothetical protein F1847_06625 [Thermodesulfobacterium sp. TA1]